MKLFFKLLCIFSPIAFIVLCFTADESLSLFWRIVAAVGIGAVISLVQCLGGIDHSFVYPEKTKIISCPDCGYIGVGYGSFCPRCKGNNAKRIR